MADGEGETKLDWGERPQNTTADSPVAMDSLLATLRGLEDELRQQEISEASSSEYCNSFCQALMHYAGSRNSMEHGLPLLEVYCLSITCFAAARPHLTADSDKVALVLKRLSLSCFELLLSVPENEIPYEAWMQFHRSVQAAHNALLEYGSTDLQALVQITGEGGAWSNPVLIALLTGQPTNQEEVDSYIALEGDGFMEMRIKHLVKVGDVAKAMILAKACADCSSISNCMAFRQTYVSHLCDMLPSDEAIMEIARVDGKEVLEIICNLETEGQENMAFILCTTYLTQQLQHERLYCSWELTLFWSKLQRRIDPSLESFLEHCLQLGAIAKTVYHLLFLVRVIQTEAEQLGLAASVELCVRALQLPREEDTETKTSVCKTVACLLLDDLEVQRACQLTEFLLSLSKGAYDSLEELYLRPDQKYDEENAIIPNSLRCELLLALKAYWPFDPEFWDWKTLKRHCIQLLGLEPEAEEEEEEEEISHEREVENDKQESSHGGIGMGMEEPGGSGGSGNEPEVKHLEGQDKEAPATQKAAPSKKKAPGTSERYLRWQKYKFFCLICQREVIEARILHHSRKHVENGVYTCPVCLQKFHGRQEFVPHTSEHIQMPARRPLPQKKKKVKKKIDLRKEMEDDDLDDLEPGEITLDPSLLMYYQTTQDPDVLEHLLEQAATMPQKPAEDDYITFEYIDTHFQLQDREVYPCPATNCTKNFKHFKYLSVHLKAEHDNGDDNVKHYLEMKDRREKCTFCRRHFMTAYHHRKHRRVHYGDQPYMCVVSGCGARFNTTNELIAHKQSHGFRLSYRCELKGCSLSFCDLGQLYHHEAQHFRDAAYSCTNPGCKKFYYSKKDFLKHLATHGISFSEEDFIAQRNRKRKPADPFMEDSSSAKKPIMEELLNDVKNDAAGFSPAGTSSSFQQSGSKEPKGTLTCVAVCFDGKKFTCGFESCGRTFTQAREIQRHLKCVHPGQFKSEKKGQRKLNKEKSTKTKDIKVEQSGADKSTQGHSSCLPTQGSNQERSCSPAVDSLDPYVSPPVSPGIEDPLRDILMGLSQLSLKPSSPRNSFCDPCYPISGSSISQVSCPPTMSANSTPKTMRKKAASKSQPSVGSSEKTMSTAESLQTPSLPLDMPLQMDHQISSFLVQPSTKPYACEVKGCGFKSVTSSALMSHYVRKHSFSKERVKGMDIFRTNKFKPFKCHLCPKGYRQKSELRVHYLQMHNISEAVVEQMSCSLKRREEGKATEPSKPKVSLKQSTPLQKKAGKVQKEEPAIWQQKYPKKKGALWKLKLERENGIVKAEDKNKKADMKAKPSPALQSNGEEEEVEERASREGRGSRRLVAKGNLCYILTKYHKPYHCVHKDCSSAFTHQSGLVRHLQSVHRYNRSQLCLEEDVDYHHSTGVKRDTAKPHRLSCKHKGCRKHFHSSSSLWRHYRSHHAAEEAMPASPEASEAAGHPSPPEPTTPISEEPIRQFRCCYGDCNATYHLYSSLLRHTSHVHRNQTPQKLPPQQVHCKFEGCTRVFSQNSSYKKHVFYRHCDYYDSLVLRLQNAHKKDKSASGCQKKLIVTAASKPAPPQKDASKLPLRHSLRHCPKSQDAIQAAESIEEITEEPVKKRVKARCPRKRDPELVFRTHEEALQMCQDRCLPVAYPCMVQDCDSVLTVESSMRRHYLKCHKMSCHQFNTNQEKLVNNAEQLEELIQKKSALSTRSDMARAPNGVLKVEYQAEPENPGGPSLPMSLHSIKTDPLGGQDPLGFSEEVPAESSVLVGADDLLYGEPLKNGHGGQEELPTQSSHGLQSPVPPLVPPPLDLSPPSSLRFTVDEGFMDCSSKECGGRVVANASVPFPVTPTRQPLKRKNELSEPLPTPQPMPKDSQPLGSTPRTFDLTAYKPMGFESSFLKFIQESKDKEDEFEEGGPWGSHPRADPPVMTPRRRDSHRRNCSVKENSQRGLTVTRSRRSRPSPLKPLLSAGEYASVQNLRSILDRALTGCGDLAIKQLQYLRPVVVLERSKFSTSLLDLFPTKKPEKLLRGSS
ncbi:zinc finger protein Rlf [Megalops cyprinoides]|uniref:zinc finger protein Rlf n=1 Tax=Megalops cyprinoides TaxID=118141 RepID=UPI001864657C|nr:zinc finger protein Rlf [Megalops cyprinoides]